MNISAHELTNYFNDINTNKERAITKYYNSIESQHIPINKNHIFLGLLCVLGGGLLCYIIYNQRKVNNSQQDKITQMEEIIKSLSTIKPDPLTL